jgi:hypothetical protein
LALAAAALLAVGVLASGHGPTISARSPVTPTTGVAVSPTVTGEAEVRTVREYYALLDHGGVDEGISWLTTAYQRRTGGPSTYRDFWATIAHVEVLDVTPSDGTAQATLHYTKTDGAVSTERVTMRFAPDPSSSGHLLIDDYHVD